MAGVAALLDAAETLEREAASRWDPKLRLSLPIAATAVDPENELRQQLARLRLYAAATGRMQQFEQFVHKCAEQLGRVEFYSLIPEKYVQCADIKAACDEFERNYKRSLLAVLQEFV